MVTKQVTRVLSHASRTRIMRYDVHTKVPAVKTNMAAAPRAAQWLTAVDGTRHPLIEISCDSSDDEVAASGSCDALAPLDPAAARAAALAGDTSGMAR